MKDDYSLLALGLLGSHNRSGPVCQTGGIAWLLLECSGEGPALIPYDWAFIQRCTACHHVLSMLSVICPSEGWLMLFSVYTVRSCCCWLKSLCRAASSLVVYCPCSVRCGLRFTLSKGSPLASLWRGGIVPSLCWLGTVGDQGPMPIAWHVFGGCCREDLWIRK